MPKVRLPLNIARSQTIYHTIEEITEIENTAGQKNSRY